MTNNFNAQGLVENKEMRDLALQELVKKNKDLLELNVWTAMGTRFAMILPGFMTYEQVAEFFEVDSKSVKNHFKTSRPNYSELISAGAKKYSVAEFNKLQEELESSNESGRLNRKIKINNTGVVLIPLPAVIKLGMFMTGTEKAIEFRDLVIKELATGVQTRQALETTTKNLLDRLVIDARNGIIIEVNQIRKAVTDVTNQAKLVKQESLRNTIKQLTELQKHYEKLRDKKMSELSSMEESENPVLYFQLDGEIEDLSNLTFAISKSNGMVKNVLNSYITTVLKSVDNNLVYNLTDPYLAAYPEDANLKDIEKNKRLSELKDKLAQAGYMKKEGFQSTKTIKHKVDSTGRIVKRTKAGEEYTIIEEKKKVMKFMYVPAEGKEWVFNKQVGEITSTKAAQTFKLSKYGFELFKRLFEEIKKCDEEGLDYNTIQITKSDFESYYVNLAMKEMK